MRYKEVTNIIRDIGLPSAYRSFPKEIAKSPPYIVYYYTGNNDLYADNINYQTIVNLRIELYTREKEFEIEKHVESALTGAELTYDKDEIYIDDEEMYEIVYESEVIINGE